LKDYKRSFEFSPISQETGELSGRVFAFDDTTFADGMQEVIPKGCKVDIDKNAMLLLSHRKDKMLGRNGHNLSFELKEDGLWFRCKKAATGIYDEALKLVKEKIIGGVSAGFSARPVYDGETRKFNKLFVTEISLCGNPAYSSSFVHAREKNPTLKYKHLPPELFK